MACCCARQASPCKCLPSLSAKHLAVGLLWDACRYYGLAFLVAEYKVEPVITDSIDSAVAKVNGGDCAAFAYESAVPAGEVRYQVRTQIASFYNINAAFPLRTPHWVRPRIGRQLA